MKRNLFFSREVRQALLTSASYSALCTCVALLVFGLLAVNCAIPQQGQHIPETEMQATENQASLPESATVRLQEQPYLRNAFKESMPASRSGLDDLFVRTRGTVQHAAIVSGGSFDVLKTFVANGWAPIVMIQFQGRTPEILPVSGYNDPLSEVSLQNPTNLAKRRLTYKEFQTAWSKNSQNKCVLITPQQITEADLKKVLVKYLPAEAFQQVSIRSR